MDDGIIPLFAEFDTAFGFCLRDIQFIPGESDQAQDAAYPACKGGFEVFDSGVFDRAEGVQVCFGQAGLLVEHVAEVFVGGEGQVGIL